MIRTIAILLLLAATAAHAQLTTTVKRIRLEYATEPELAASTLEFGHVVVNEGNLADLRIGDGATPGGIRVGADWWTNNMLSAWGGLSRVDVEALVALSIPHVDLTPYAFSADLLDYAPLSDYAAATNAIWGSLATKAAASNLVAEAARLDGRIDGISAASLGALTEEVDPEWGAASPDVARLRDVEALLALSLGYFQEKDTAALSAVAAVSDRVDVIESWGDHAEGSIYPSTATNSYIRPDGGTNTISFDESGNMIIAVDGTAAMMISPAGNVGVRTTPSASFSLRTDKSFFAGGSVRAGAGLASLNGKIYVNNLLNSYIELVGTNLMFTATNGITGRIQIIYE